MAVGNGTNVYGTIRYLDGRVGNPNGFDLYRIADDSVSDTNQTFVSVAADSQISPRWQTTVRFGTTNQESLYTNPTPSGIPFDPFGFGANYLGETVTLDGCRRTNGHRAGHSRLRRRVPAVRSRRVPRANRCLARPRSSGRATWRFRPAAASSTRPATAIPMPTRSDTRNNGGAFVEGRATLVNRVYISAGIGVEHNEVFETAYTPRLSVAAYLRNPSNEQIGETKVTLNAGKGIKAPSVYQGQNSLFALVNGTPAGAGVDPLGPEKSRSFDVGLEQAFAASRFRARVGYFNNTFENLLEFLSRTQLVAAGVPPDVAAATAFGAYINSASFDAQGVELSADAAIGAGFRFSASYTFLDAEVTEAFGRSAVFNPVISHDPDWRLFATRRCTAVPASHQLGHAVCRLYDRTVRRRPVRLFRRQARRQHVPERRLLR